MESVRDVADRFKVVARRLPQHVAESLDHRLDILRAVHAPARTDLRHEAAQFGRNFRTSEYHHALPLFKDAAVMVACQRSCRRAGEYGRTLRIRSANVPRYGNESQQLSSATP